MTHTITKIEALAKYLGEEVENLTEEHPEVFSVGQQEYLVLTDNEADEKAKEYILDSLWAFNKSFLDAHSKAIRQIPDKEFKDMQGKLCESFNDAIKAMIDDMDHLIADAILADGRGHFLSGYDGEENEEGEYFIYRVN